MAAAGHPFWGRAFTGYTGADARWGQLAALVCTECYGAAQQPCRRGVAYQRRSPREPGVFAGIDWSRCLRYCNVWGTPLAHDTANNNHGCRVRVCRRLPNVCLTASRGLGLQAVHTDRDYGASREGPKQHRRGPRRVRGGDPNCEFITSDPPESLATDSGSARSISAA